MKWDNENSATKRCSKCGCVKCVTEFSRASKEKSGYKSACKACVKVDNAEYYKRNKQRIDEKNKRWRDANPELMLEYSKRWAERNPEKRLAATVAWQRRNPDKVVVMQARWYAATKEKRKAYSNNWWSNNRDARRRYDKVRRELIKSAGGKFTRSDWMYLYELQRGRCAGCGCDIDSSAHADHIVPLVRGGSNGRDNRQLLCRSCNSQKGVKPQAQFMRLKRSKLI